VRDRGGNAIASQDRKRAATTGGETEIFEPGRQVGQQNPDLPEVSSQEGRRVRQDGFPITGNEPLIARMDGGTGVRRLRKDLSGLGFQAETNVIAVGVFSEGKNRRGVVQGGQTGIAVHGEIAAAAGIPSHPRDSAKGKDGPRKNHGNEEFAPIAEDEDGKKRHHKQGKQHVHGFHIGSRRRADGSRGKTGKTRGAPGHDEEQSLPRADKPKQCVGKNQGGIGNGREIAGKTQGRKESGRASGKTSAALRHGKQRQGGQQRTRKTVPKTTAAGEKTHQQQEKRIPGRTLNSRRTVLHRVRACLQKGFGRFVISGTVGTRKETPIAMEKDGERGSQKHHERNHGKPNPIRGRGVFRPEARGEKRLEDGMSEARRLHGSRGERWDGLPVGGDFFLNPTRQVCIQEAVLHQFFKREDT